MSYASTARRACDAVSFEDIDTSESSRSAVQLSSAAPSPGSWAFDGFTFNRTAGAGGSIVVTIRIYDASSSGNCIYEDNVTVSANSGKGSTGGVMGLGMPFNRSGAAGLWATATADSGSDTDGTLLVYLTPLRAL